MNRIELDLDLKMINKIKFDIYITYKYLYNNLQRQEEAKIQYSISA